MKITKRSVNGKKHNVAFKIGGSWRTRPEAVKLAKAGKIDDVIVCSGSNGSYLRSTNGTPNIDSLDSVNHNTLRKCHVGK